MSSMRRVLAMLCLAMTVVGCGGRLRTEYGASEGSVARESPAGVSLFRGMCEADGRRTMLVRSFSPRSSTKLQAIVWTPDSFLKHKAATYDWIERWLATGGKTLVYVGRDYSPVAEYWSQIANDANEQEDPDGYIEAMQDRATQQAELDLMRANSRKKMATPWFLMDHEQTTEQRITSFDGPWANGIDPNQAKISLRSHIHGYDSYSKEELEKMFEKPPTAAATTAAATTAAATTAAATKSTTPPEFELEWQSSDEDMLKLVKELRDDEMPELSPLLATDKGLPLIAKVTSPGWGDSKIVVLANASLISNIALVNSQNRKLAYNVLDLLPKKDIGFLSGVMDPLVRKDDSSDQQKGFEMLTIWPLNVITIHAVFLGMLMLLAVYPIFGRAKQLPPRTTRDFGQHVDAVGSLLRKSKDRFYATSTIADYFRIVRKEPTSPWSNIDPAQKEAQSPFQANDELGIRN
ncbi:MAG: hypothetical protein ABL921_16725 [Pirellula sp.]